MLALAFRSSPYDFEPLEVGKAEALANDLARTVEQHFPVVVFLQGFWRSVSNNFLEARMVAFLKLSGG